MERYVYIDLLFMLNLFMDFVVIVLTGKLCRRAVKKRRAITGALLAAAVYCVFYALVGGVPAVLAGVAGMAAGLAIAYAPTGIFLLAKLLGGAAVLTFALGGGCFAAYSVLTGFGMPGMFPAWLLIVGSASAYIGVKVLIKKIKQKVQRVIVEAKVNVSGKGAAFNALVDTGHDLREPISGKPVIVAEFNAVKNLLPDEVRRMFCEKTEDDLDNCARVFTLAGFANRLRLLPFVAIGEQNGMLVGFRPDEALVGESRRDVIIAVYNGELSADNEYAALVSAKLMEDSYEA